MTTTEELVCPECGATTKADGTPFPNYQSLNWHITGKHGSKSQRARSRLRPVEDDDEPKERTEGASTGAGSPPEGGEGTASLPEDPPAPPASPDPTPRRPSFMDRFRGRQRGRVAEPKKAASGERIPKRTWGAVRGKRVALDADFSDLWALIGRRLEGGPNFPTGRMMQYQAPAAGYIFDDALKGTLPDRILLQPLARGREKWEPLMFLVLGPLMTMAITQTQYALQEASGQGDMERVNALQRKFAVQAESFEWVMDKMLPSLAPGIKRARDEAEKADKAIQEAMPELGEEDPAEVLRVMRERAQRRTHAADMLRGMLFAPPAGWSPPAQSPTEESDGSREVFHGAGGDHQEGPVAL